MIEIFYLLIGIVVLFGIGNKVYELLRLREDCLIEELVFSFGLGTFVVIYLTFFIGIIGYYYKWVFYLLLLTSLILCYKNILRLKNIILTTTTKEKKSNFNFNTLLKAFLAIFFLLNLLSALAPPRSADTVWYQLAIPKQYIKEHRIVYLPSMVWAEIPNAMQMLFLPIMFLSNGTTAQMLVFAITTVLALSIYSFTSRVASKRAALVAATIFYTMPFVSLYSARGYIDLPAAFFCFLAFYGFYKWHNTKEDRWLIVSALIAGLATATKITLLITLPVLLFSIIYFNKPNWKGLIKSGAAFSIISLLIVSPWLIKAYINTGNPIYPFFFGGKYWNDDLTTLQQAQQEFKGMGKSIKDFLLLPWNITMHSEKFGEITGIGPLFLTLVPPLFFIKKKKTIKWLLAASLLLAIPLLLIVQHTRYLLFIFPILAVVAGYSVDALKKEKITMTIPLLLTAVIVFNLIFWVGINAKNIPVVIGIQNEDDYLGKYTTNYYATQYANANLPDNSLTCLYGDGRAYYFEKSFVWCSPIFQGYINFIQLNEQGILQRFNELGITHILIDPFEYQYNDDNQKIPKRKEAIDESNAKVEKIVEEHGTLLFEKDGQKIYAIKYP